MPGHPELRASRLSATTRLAAQSPPTRVTAPAAPRLRGGGHDAAAGRAAAVAGRNRVGPRPRETGQGDPPTAPGAGRARGLGGQHPVVASPDVLPCLVKQDPLGLARHQRLGRDRDPLQNAALVLLLRQPVERASSLLSAACWSRSTSLRSATATTPSQRLCRACGVRGWRRIASLVMQRGSRNGQRLHQISARVAAVQWCCCRMPRGAISGRCRAPHEPLLRAQQV
jgi:hypothetical protein